MNRMSFYSKENQFIAELPPTPFSPPSGPEESPTLRRQKYGTCPECDEPNSGHDWCGPCTSHSYLQTYPDRVSGNEIIDEFISNSQSASTSQYNFIEWIPWSMLSDVEWHADGGFGSVLKAVWLEGPISSTGEIFERDASGFVAIKTLENSAATTPEFFEEISASLRHSFRYPIATYYGITQKPDTLEFAMVVNFAADGDLRGYLRGNFSKLTWKQRLDMLHDIIRGLVMIHNAGYVHQNFHSGNILRDGDSSFISDFGITKSATEDERDAVWGVLPSVAPEVLLGSVYTSAADIYGFGIIMWELATGIPPFADRAHDSDLALDIVRGLRPAIGDDVPEVYAELVQQCWDSEPSKRPTATVIERTLQRWYSDLLDESNVEVAESTAQFKAADENRKPPQENEEEDEIKIHPEACYTSRLLKFPELSELYNKGEKPNSD